MGTWVHACTRALFGWRRVRCGCGWRSVEQTHGCSPQAREREQLQRAAHAQQLSEQQEMLQRLSSRLSSTKMAESEAQVTLPAEWNLNRHADHT